MTRKPSTASGYSPEFKELAVQTCLHVATKLGDLMQDVVVVGGLVPTLIADHDDGERHVGTRDLDLGLALALLEEQRYRELTTRLRDAGFEPSTNERGHITRQRWALTGGLAIDFLIPPSAPGDKGGTIKSIEEDFAALVTPGLHLAFRDRMQVVLRGRTVLEEEAERVVQVCGPGAYLMLKALAFDGRGENKDAYDLCYVLRNYAGGVEAVADRVKPLREDDAAERSLEILSGISRPTMELARCASPRS